MLVDKIPEDERVDENACLRLNPPHPGPVIRGGCIGRDAVDYGGVLTVDEVAGRLCGNPAMLRDVVHGHIVSSPELALKLEAVGRVSAKAWNWRQTKCDLTQACKRLNDNPPAGA